ncbi:MAG: IS701 family transposase [Chloroflexi bacterium]|nr:IS701 family transposase [Chloroflexota bacterium]
MAISTDAAKAPTLSAASRWGLPAEAVANLADRLRNLWSRFSHCWHTRTRDSSENGYVYLRGLLTMETKRNFAHIARRILHPSEDGQALQQFMSDSPWPGQVVIQQVQAEITAKPAFQQGGVLLLDDTPDEKAGDHTAGAGRQRNGRLGTVDMSQVGAMLAWTNGTIWTWVDGELYLPKDWFAPEKADLRQHLGIPANRRFETKAQLGWRMIQRAKANGLPFEAIACDDFYGRDGRLRRRLDEAGLVYMADVRADTQVYVTRPDFGPQPPTYYRRRKHPSQPVTVQAVARCSTTHFQRVQVRHTERGILEDRFAARRVWTIRDGKVAEEWLVIRLEANGHHSYALSNAPADTPLSRLAWLKCIRYFVERCNQDAKSEAGWDELQAQKYLAWEHHLALTVLVTWFVAETKYDWAQTYARDPQLAQQLAVEVLPALSMANIRTLLQAVLPLPQLSPEEATYLVVKHLINRSRSTSSRLKAQRCSRDSP